MSELLEQLNEALRCTVVLFFGLLLWFPIFYFSPGFLRPALFGVAIWGGYFITDGERPDGIVCFLISAIVGYVYWMFFEWAGAIWWSVFVVAVMFGRWRIKVARSRANSIVAPPLPTVANLPLPPNYVATKDDPSVR